MYKYRSWSPLPVSSLESEFKDFRDWRSAVDSLYAYLTSLYRTTHWYGAPRVSGSNIVLEWNRFTEKTKWFYGLLQQSSCSFFTTRISSNSIFRKYEATMWEFTKFWLAIMLPWVVSSPGSDLTTNSPCTPVFSHSCSHLALNLVLQFKRKSTD